MGLVGVAVLHGLCGGFLNGLQLLLLRLGLGVLEHHGGEIELLVAVDVVFLFQKAHGVVRQVHKGPFLHFAALGGQAGPLLDEGVDRRAVHVLGVVGVAIFIIELQNAQPWRAVPGKIDDGQIGPRDGGVGVHIIEQHPRDAAGEVYEIVVVFQLVLEGRIRQRAALADIVAG